MIHKMPSAICTKDKLKEGHIWTEICNKNNLHQNTNT